MNKQYIKTLETKIKDVFEGEIDSTWESKVLDLFRLLVASKLVHGPYGIIIRSKINNILMVIERQQIVINGNTYPVNPKGIIPIDVDLKSLPTDLKVIKDYVIRQMHDYRFALPVEIR